MHSLIVGLRSGLTLLRSEPAAALAAIVALGLGIGSSTTMFSIVRGGTRALPFEDAGSIVAVQRLAARPGATTVSTLRDYRLWSRAPRSFQALGAFQTRSPNLGDDGGAPERVSAAAVTVGAFELLRIRPAVGRGLIADDSREGAEPAAILSHALWMRRYGGSASILGRTIRLDGATHTIVGVMPPRFGFPINASVWTTLPDGGVATEREVVQVFGRLATGATRKAARAELLAVAQGAAGTDEERSGLALEVIGFTELETPSQVRWGLYLLWMAATGVLVIACVNVAALFIARATERARDVAVRLALGAGRRHILIERGAESLLFSTLALLAGLGMAGAATRAFRIAAADILEAFWMDFRVDTTVVLYAWALAAGAAAAASLVPALRASRTDVAATLRDGGIGSSGLRIGGLTRGLLVVQIAFACGLLSLTLLLGQAAIALHAREWPFDPDGVLTAQIGVPQGMLDDEETRTRLLVALDDELRRLPGARSAALASVLPGRGAGNWTFSFDGPALDPARLPSTGVTLVSPSYFDTLGARARRGRILTAHDRPGAPLAAVVNDSFVRRYSSDRDPIGRRLWLGRRELTVVGVVPDLMPGDVDDAAQDGLYVSIHQMRPFAVRVLAARTPDPLALVRPLRAAVDRVDPDLPIFEAFTVRQAAMRDKQVLDILSSLFGVFGVGALLLTAIGLYSVTAFSIAQRRRELGIRVALGATRRDLVRLLGRQSGRQLAIGLACGGLLASALTRGFAAAVELSTGDSRLILGGVFLGLLATAVPALAGPVLRAAGIDPTRALRESA